MGDLLSTPSKPSPNSNATTTMSSSEIPETSQEPKPQTDPTHQPKTLETQKPPQESSDPPMNNDPETLGNQEDEKDVEGEEEEEEEEEEEGECGFCLFMKGGGCKDSFIDWEKCVEEGEKNKEDIVEKCFEVTAALKKCMEAHQDYYEPIFKAEKAAEEEAVRELEKEKEKEKEKEAGGSASESSGSEKSGSS